MWGHVRSGATHFQLRQTPPPGNPVRQFFHGLSLPFHIARALRTDAVAWRRYRRVAIIQCLVILGLVFFFKRSAFDRVDLDLGPEEAPAEAIEKPAQARLQRQSRREAQEAVRQVREELAAAGISTPEIKVVIDEDTSPAEAPPKPPAAAVVKKPQERLGFFARQLQLWAALFATMQIVQWVVIALSRDYHDAISRDASLLTAVEPEDEPLTPRVRLDVTWMQKKVSRRIRGFVVFAAGLPVLLLLAAPLCSVQNLLAVFIPVWSAYWLVVFTAGKSARAWESTSGRPPWFLRAWTWLTTRMPGFRWETLQGYGRFWERRTLSVFSPAIEVEKQPWAFAGLALVRALAMLPLVKCFLRPLIPVAAAHLLVAHRAASTPASPVEAPAPTTASAA
ncbi:hypothetical protein [Hyalangium rubrum]|uniref:DUF2868 domain-containing protein n=1 Tax=Hyalangium rubrum TaxID=3103134 RepID=A0ABU5GWP1_9BACT|nr:hypothetical protein [Hyalangium sp. s54d21]MDY7225506.1 hypothetical protein [Hyalangium sp. s54d21]